MVLCQEDLDLLSSRGKQLLGELSSIPDCEPQALRQDLEAVVDHWLDVSGSTCWSFFHVHEALKGIVG